MVRKSMVQYMQIIMGVVLLLSSIVAGAQGNRSDRENASTGDSGRGARSERVRQDIDLQPLYDIQAAFEAVAFDVQPVVVEIDTISVVRRSVPRTFSPWDFFFNRTPPPANEERELRRPGLGSGVIVRRQGRNVYVLTNDHVIGNASEITTRLFDGREFEASVVGRDSALDLALIRFRTAEDIPTARLGDSDDLRVGHWVLAIGNPLGFESTVTAGIISALRREPPDGARITNFTDYIQTDAAINRGNSGGALVNLEGEVVGINTWIASQTGGSQGLGFAIPINNAKQAIDDFITSGRVIYGWLGVLVADPIEARLPGLARSLDVEDKEGTLVTNVFRGAPSARDGIRPGDFITHINNNNIRNTAEVQRSIAAIEPGETATFLVIRQRRPEELQIRLEQRAPEESIDNSDLWPGIVVAELTAALREDRQLTENVQGIIALGIYEGSPAATAGLRNGDVITRLGDTRMRSTRDFYTALNGATGRTLSMGLLRDGVEIGIELPNL